MLKTEPDFIQVPPQAQRLLRLCLEKDPKRRLRDIGDFRSLWQEPLPKEEQANASVCKCTEPGKSGQMSKGIGAIAPAGAPRFCHPGTSTASRSGCISHSNRKMPLAVDESPLNSQLRN